MAIFALPAILGFLIGGTLPPTLAAGMIPAQVIAGVEDVDKVAQKIGAYAPAVCKASDPLIDRLVDAEDRRARGRNTVLHRIADELGAAADEVCHDTVTAHNTPLGRISVIVRALHAAQAARAALGPPSPAASPEEALHVPHGRG